MPAAKPPFQRLLANYSVIDATGCWQWTGHRFRNGYGCIKAFGRMASAHRLSYELHKGPVPDGKEILHSCDNRLCINPDHLRPGTHAENMQEAKIRGRMLAGERHPMFGRKKPPGIKNRLSKPVLVLGNTYASQKEAERALGLGSGTVRYWIKTSSAKATPLSRQDYENAQSL